MKRTFLLLTCTCAASLAAAQDLPKVLSSRTRPLGERMVTFEKIQPLALPPLPAPKRSQLSEVDLAAARAAALEHHKDHRFLFLGATVYLPDGDPGKAISYVRYWPEPGGEPVSMWVHANLLWLGGFAEFEDDAAIYSLLMACSQGAREALPLLPDFREVPDFSQPNSGEIRLIEGPAIPPIMVSLLEHYRAHHPEMRAQHERRQREAERLRLARLADPPEKKNLRVRYFHAGKALRAKLLPPTSATR